MIPDSEDPISAARGMLIGSGMFKAYLKEKSPACGVHFIKRNDEKVEGSGVAASLLRLHGIKLFPVD